MKTAAIWFCLLFATASLLADPYAAAIRQAKNVAATASSTRQDNQDNAPAPAQPAPIPPAQNNPSPNPELEATLQNIADLRANLDTLSRLTDTNAIAEKKLSLTGNLTAAASGTKPSPATVAKLSDDLATVLAGNDKLHPQNQKLAQYLHAIFNSSHLSTVQQQTIFDGVGKILQNGGVAPDQATNVVNDIKAIAKETQ
jgi:hypothetical protein